MWIAASRDVSQWFEPVSPVASPDQYLEGSPLDRLIFTGLLVAAVAVLVDRAPRVKELLRANAPLVVFFLYCAVSVLWSDYPFVAFKRWTKAVGNLLMVLVVLTEPEPLAAVKRLLIRTGFSLVPLSVLLIKYFPQLGRGFSSWTGEAYNNGVAAGKNGLGVACLIFGLASFWRLLETLDTKWRARLTRSIVAHGTVFAMAMWLLWKADSATSIGAFLTGSVLLVVTTPRIFGFERGAVHLVAIGLVALTGFAVFFDAGGSLVQAMGRDPTLTTRTQLWQELLRVSVDPWVGAGFESFWLGARAKALWMEHWWHPNQAHNGYLEIFLNLGWVGVMLLGFVILRGYRAVVGSLSREPALGRLRLAIFVAAIVYNWTEAAFKVMHPMWIMFLLAATVVEPGAEAAGGEVRPATSRPARHLVPPPT
jgi:O-antigen ligase